MKLHFSIESGDFVNAGAVSGEVKKALKQLDFPSDFIRKVVISCYEAEMNIVVHAYRGKVEVDFESDRIVMRFDDEGPGIENIDLAMQEGFSTASEQVREMGFGAGMGLPNISRNSDDLLIQSFKGKGTTIIITHKINKYGEV